MFRFDKYTKEEFIEAIKTSFSLRQVLRKLKIKEAGGNYSTIKKKIKFLDLDISHFTGKGHLKGKTHNWSKSKPLEEVMIEGSTYHRGSLKKRLISTNILKNKCKICGQLPEWKGLKLVMVLDHINGVRDDHREENLRLLCPNCNSQQETFAGGNCKGQYRGGYIDRICFNCGNKITRNSISGFCGKCSKKEKSKINKITNNYCVTCGENISKKAKYCIICGHLKNRKVKNRPSVEVSLKEIKDTNYCAVGRKYGVSDSSVRKWMKN